jgi:hypothetical protein
MSLINAAPVSRFQDLVSIKGIGEIPLPTNPQVDRHD